jgi:hypothetical protein
VPLDVSVSQSPHHLDLHSSAKNEAQIRLGLRAFRAQLSEDAVASHAAVDFLVKTVGRATVKEVRPERRECRLQAGENECQPPP